MKILLQNNEIKQLYCSYMDDDLKIGQCVKFNSSNGMLSFKQLMYHKKKYKCANLAIYTHSNKKLINKK